VPERKSYTTLMYKPGKGRFHYACSVQTSMCLCVFVLVCLCVCMCGCYPLWWYLLCLWNHYAMCKLHLLKHIHTHMQKHKSMHTHTHIHTHAESQKHAHAYAKHTHAHTLTHTTTHIRTFTHRPQPELCKGNKRCCVRGHGSAGQ